MITYLKNLFELTKPRITLLVLVTAFSGMWLAEKKMPDLRLIFFTLLGLALAASSSSSLNNFIDRNIDKIMDRTKNRALPLNRVQPVHALIMGVVLGLLSFVVLYTQVNTLTAALGVFTICFYIGIYTIWLKRTTSHCTVIGGIAGALPPVIGLAAVNNQIGLIALALFLVMFIWQPPHFWALALVRSEEYRKARIPMLPVVKGETVTKRQMLYYTIALMPASLAPYWLGIAGVLYLSVTLLLDVIYLGWTIHFVRSEFRPTSAKNLFWFSIFYLAALFIMLFVDCV